MSPGAAMTSPNKRTIVRTSCSGKVDVSSGRGVDFMMDGVKPLKNRSALFVEVCFHFLIGGSLRGNSLFRHLRAGNPNDGIEHHPAEIILLPVLVKMTASESEGAAATGAGGALVNPHHVLRLLALEDRLADLR